MFMADSSPVDGALKFVNTLTGATKERYIRKLQYLHGGPGVPLDKLVCPYDIPDKQWIDYVGKWPQLNLAIYRIMQIVCGGKVSRLHDLLVIRGKNFRDCTAIRNTL